jgi:cytochrome c
MSMRAVALSTLAVLAVAGPALADPGQDAYNDKCADCHALQPMAGETAPPLGGVVGRKIASASEFQYSAALKSKNGVWSEAALDTFLTNPATYAPGVQMFASVPDAAQRRLIIDYLKAQK